MLPNRLVTCEFCKKQFTRSNRQPGRREFCSRECCRRYFVRTAYGDKKSTVPIRLICPNCKNFFHRPKSKAMQKRKKRTKQFCSVRCCVAFRRGRHSPNWRGGRSAPNDYRIRQVRWQRIRNAVRARDKSTCGICGAERVKPGPQFHVDHIIPHIFAEQLAPDHADDQENLLLLCPSDHAKKLSAEASLLIGDWIKWEVRLREIGYPMARVHAALGHLRACAENIYAKNKIMLDNLSSVMQVSA